MRRQLSCPQCFLFLLLLVFSGLLQPARAFSQTPEIDRLIQKGNQAQEKGELEEAGDHFEAALKLNKNSLPALRGLSELALQEENWGDLKKWNEKILEFNQADLLAKYHLGIAFRESGKFKALFLRKRDFSNSERYFDEVLAADSTFQDVLLQRALLERHRENWHTAVVWGHRQIDLKPDLPAANVGLFKLYRLFLVNGKDSEISAWLNSRADEWAHYFQGEYARRQNELERADSLLSQTLSDVQLDGVLRTPAYLSLVRTAVARDSALLATEYYFDALNSASRPVDFVFFLEDLKYLLTDSELAEIREQASLQDSLAFVQRFWAGREPAPASPVKFRLVEHYRRLIKAESDFWYDGPRSWANNPDELNYLQFPEVFRLNDEFNDKGLVFIRHGEPNDIARTLGDGVESNESWLYYEREDRRKLLFHFMISEFGAGNNWRLVPVLTDFSMLEDRLGWDHSITRLRQSRSRIEYEANKSQISDEASEMVAYGMSTDFQTWPDDIVPIEMPYYLANFRGENGLTRTELYFGVPLADLQAAKETGQISFEYGSAVLDSNFRENKSFSNRKSVANKNANERPGGFFIADYVTGLRPGHYHISFYARQNLSSFNGLGGENFETDIPAFSDNLSLSDLLPAYKLVSQISPSAAQASNRKISVNPSRTFALASPVHLYYEIYNLTTDESGANSYEIENQITLLKEKKSGLGKVFGFLGGGKDEDISIKEQRHGNRPDVAESMSFDVSKLAPGEYELKVTVRDLLANREVEKTLALELVEANK